MRRLLQILIPAVAAATAVTACDSSPSRPVLPSTGVAWGQVYVDRNGNGKADNGIDVVAPNVRVLLLVPGSQSQVAQATTNPSGYYVMRDVPVGRYQVMVDTTTIGDTLQVSKMDSAAVTVGARDSVMDNIALGYPTSNLAGVRKLAIGRKVQVDAIALNGWTAFGDSTIDVMDASGTLRATRVLPNVLSLAGDSLRLVGTVSTRDGQVVLTNVTATVLSSGGIVPAPTVLTTATAASAQGGTLDAALAQVKGANIISAAVDGDGNYVVTVDDGSGPLAVSLAARSGMTIPSTLIAGAELDATGVLIPAAGGGSWILRPRSNADLKATFVTKTIAQVRAAVVGRVVQVEGLALNGWSTFGDSTVHIVDPTGALRTVRVAPVTLFAGDSVRLLGLVAMRDGQVVLTNVTATVLATGRTLPAAHTITTAVANTGDNGNLDAALVQLTSVTVKGIGVDLTTGDFLMQVDDGTGTVIVNVDRNLGLATARYTIGSTLDITGLLIPASGGATWIVKPRGGADLVLK